MDGAVIETVSRCSDAQAPDLVEVLPVPRRQRQSMLEGGRRDERVGHAELGLSCDASRSFGDCAIDRELPERRQQLRHDVRCTVAGEELGAGHH